jgi:RNA 2',3'-cyclic 3'-phosphodiesterase
MEGSRPSPTPASARLFVALWPDPAVRARLAAQRDALSVTAGARPVSDANLHATLHFIGTIERERIAALWSALSAVPARPVCLRATALAIWRGGTVVLQLQGDPALDDLHADTGAALLRCGIALDARPFSPHVTLARAAALTGLPPAPAELEWHANGFALVESTGGSRSTYRVLAEH